MPFPESDRVIYGITPLVQVICQVRFPPILEIGSNSPAAFQKAIRAAYPLYEQQLSVSQLETEALLKRFGPALPTALAATHSFKSEDGDKEIQLTNEALAVIDNAYVRWERFEESFEVAKAALESIYEPSFYSRIGLRYIDIVYREKLGLEDTDWAEIMNPQLAGPFADKSIGPKVKDLKGELVVEVGDGDRVTIRHGLGKQKGDEEHGYLIDADFFTTAKEEGANVSRKLKNFNRLAGHLFRWSISEELHRALQPEWPGD